MYAKKPFERLPKDVVPSNYAVGIQPDLKNFTFDGHVDITVQVTKASDKITMNSRDLTVHNVSYKGHGQEFSHDVHVAYSEPDETVTFTFPEKLKTGTGLLAVSYSGLITGNMKGLYRSKYFTASGEERYSAVTQLEPAFARTVLPCWDEPGVKATFDVSLIVAKHLVALSNMPVVKETTYESDDSLKVVSFERSPIMSTYLLALVVGEYEYVEDRDSDGVLVRVYTPVGKTAQGTFALEVSKKVLPFYNNYFKIAYPLPKIDMIAIPDFAAGAMENWGLVTYRETTLLFDEKNSSSAVKQHVAVVVGHELAHQWFGNLVTMSWWSDLWLNEGFAAWIENLSVDHFFKEFDMWTQFVAETLTPALTLDALKSSHPIQVEVGDPKEVDEIFDNISYNKGASIIRMLHDYIGDEDFRKGMHAYLSHHAYKNTITDDLWAALAKASGKPVRDVMTTWTLQLGFPVLNVKLAPKKGKHCRIELSQEKFNADGSREKDGSTWMVPVSVLTREGDRQHVHKFLLSKRSDTFTLEGFAAEDNADLMIKVNAGAVGFYRVHYTDDLLLRLIPAIKDQSLGPIDRVSLQNDLFALAGAGFSSTVEALKVAQAMDNETDYTVWSDLTANLTALGHLFQTTDYFDRFNSGMLCLYRPIMSKLGWDNQPWESPLTAMLRSVVIERLGECGDEAVINEARKRFKAHCSEEHLIGADLRTAVYRTVLSNGTEDDYDELIALLRKTDLMEEKTRILTSLGAASDKKLIQRTLEFAIGDEVRAQDTVKLFSSCTGSVNGRELTWKFIQDHWDMLHDRYKSGFLLANLVKTTANFSSMERAAEIEEFFRTHDVSGGERAAQQSIESIRINARQLQRDAAELHAYFAQTCTIL